MSLCTAWTRPRHVSKLVGVTLRKNINITAKQKLTSLRSDTVNYARRFSQIHQNGDVVTTSRPKLALIGSLGGFMGSLMGLGGGFVIIPLLTSWAKFSQHSAHATSLVAVIATSLGGTVSFAMNDQIDFKTAVPLSLGAIASVGFGARLSKNLDAAALKRYLGIFVMAMAPLIPGKVYLMDFIESQKQKSLTAECDAKPKAIDKDGAVKDEELMKTAKEAATFFGLGIFTGISAGVFGVGGGALMVPALAFLTPLSHHAILGTSLAAMAVPSMTGAFHHYKMGHIQPRLALPVALGTLAGSFLGGEVAHSLPEEGLRFAFGIFMGVLGFKLFRS